MLRNTIYRVARPLIRCSEYGSVQSCRGVKADTGIVGLAVDPEARSTLRTKLQEVLEAIKIVPEDAEYRKQVEATLNYRLRVVSSEADDLEVEDQLEAQLESLTEQCKDELSLIPEMAEWQPWDVPADHKVELVLEEDVPPPTPPQAPNAPPPPPPKK